MTQSSAELAKSPQQGTFPDYAQTLSFNFLDLLSPSFWIQKAMKLAGMPDPVDYILKPFTGDYKAVYKHGDTFSNVGNAYVALADETKNRSESMTMPGIWEGNAADNFSTKLSETVNELRSLGQALQDLGNSYKESSDHIYGQYLILHEIVNFIFDLICDIVASLVIPSQWFAAAKKALEGYPRINRLITFVTKDVPAFMKAIKTMLSKGKNLLTQTKFGGVIKTLDKLEEGTKMVKGAKIGTIPIIKKGDKVVSKWDITVGTLWKANVKMPVAAAMYGSREEKIPTGGEKIQNTFQNDVSRLPPPTVGRPGTSSSSNNPYAYAAIPNFGLPGQAEGGNVTILPQ